MRASLSSLLRGIALASLAGCGGKLDDGRDHPGFDVDLCIDWNYDPVAGVTPAAGPVDYLELREQSVYEAAPTQPPVTRNVAFDGNACATATNRSACKTALENARSPSGWPSPAAALPGVSSYRYVVYTRGDTVGVVGSPDELARFFGPIDTVREAALVATAHDGFYFVCGKRARARGDGSFELIAETGGTCGRGKHLDEHDLVVLRDGHVDVKRSWFAAAGDPSCIAGRRPQGLAEARAVDRACDDGLGALLAELARMEAASIPAFSILARELALHGAPAELVRRALDARDDEIGHARTMRTQADRFGATCTRPEVHVGRPRDLFAIAQENAVEGCVHETYAAVLATMQAARAEDPELARAFATIARDEARHAELAWAVASWIEPQLDAAQREAVASARALAARTLANSVGARAPRSERVRRVAGWPPLEAEQRAVAGLQAALWAA